MYDAITACNFFMSGFQENPRFGLLKNWQAKFDGRQEKYKFGDHLNDEQKAKLVNRLKT